METCRLVLRCVLGRGGRFGVGTGSEEKNKKRHRLVSSGFFPFPLCSFLIAVERGSVLWCNARLGGSWCRA